MKDFLFKVQSVQREHGFTLVELSVVIVIIGLIVSGIVGGQNLVKAARTQKPPLKVEV